MRSKRLLLLTLLSVVNVASAAIILSPRVAQAAQAAQPVEFERCKDEACWSDSITCFYTPGGKCNPQPTGGCYVTACGVY